VPADHFEQQIRRRKLLSVGLGGSVGLLAGGTIAAWYLRNADESSVVVLGSGSAVSVLIRDERRSVLLLAGDDANSLGAALGAAQPILAPAPELVLIHPGTKERLVAKVTSGNHDHIWVLPGGTEDQGLAVARDAFNVALGTDMLVDLRPQHRSWTALVRWGDSERIAIVPNGGALRSKAAVAIVLDGSSAPSHAGQTIIGPQLDDEPEGYLGVAPGAVRHIQLSAKETRIER